MCTLACSLDLHLAFPDNVGILCAGSLWVCVWGPRDSMCRRRPGRWRRRTEGSGEMQGREGTVISLCLRHREVTSNSAIWSVTQHYLSLLPDADVLFFAPRRGGKTIPFPLWLMSDTWAAGTQAGEAVEKIKKGFRSSLLPLPFSRMVPCIN